MAGGSVKLSIYSTFDDGGAKKAERAMSRFAKAYGTMNKATGKMELTAAQTQLAELSTELDRNAAKWQGWSEKIGKFGAAVTKRVSAPAAALMTASTKLASDYESSFAKVRTIMDKQAVPAEKLQKDILDLSTATGKEANELSEATYQALSASVETSKVAGFVGKSVELAKAGFTETSTAVDTLTTVINAYKYSADDAQMISERLVQTQNKGKTTVDELASSIGNVIPTASAYNVNLDNLCSSYVILTKQGINTANATTAINGMLTELADAGSDVAGVLQEETGKSFGQLMNDGKTLGDVIKILNDHVDGDSEAFANLWGNVRASKGALAIANAGTKEFNQAMDDMANSSGLVSDALADLATPAAKAGKAVNAVKNTGIELGQEFLGALSPALEAAAEGAQKLYKDFSGLSDGEKQAAAEAVAMGAAAGPAIMGVSKIAGGIGSANKKLAGFAANLAKNKGASTASAKAVGLLGKALSGPGVLGFTAAAGAAAIVAKGIYDTKVRCDNLRDATSGLTSAVNDTAPSLEAAAGSSSAFGGAMQRTRVDIEAVTAAQAELARSIEERNSSAQTEISMLEAARNTMEEYMNKTDLTVEEQGKLRAAVELVNEKCGTQISVVDAVNGKLEDENGKILNNCKAIDEYIQKKQEQIRVDALTENLKDLYKQQADDIAAVSSATHDLKVAQSQLAEATDAGMTGEAYQAYAENADAAARAVAEAQSNLDSCNAAIEATNMQLGASVTAAEGAKQSVSDLAASSVELQNSVPAEAFESFCQHLEDTGVKVTDFKNLNQGELIELGTSYNGSIDSIVAAFGRMGVELPARTSEAANASAQALNAATPQQQAVASKAVAAVTNIFGRMKGETHRAGSEAGQSMATGISSKEGSVRSSATTTGNAAKAMHVTGSYGWGSELGANFASGIRSQIGAVAAASAQLAAAAKGPIGHSIPKEGPLRNDGKGEAEWGEHVAQNFARGMINATKYVADASDTVARAAAGGLSAQGARQRPQANAGTGAPLAGVGRGDVRVSMNVYINGAPQDGPREFAAAIADALEAKLNMED